MPTSNFQLPTPKHAVWALVVSLMIWSVPARPVAQLLNKQAPVIVGHYHLNVTSIEAHKKFWVDTLGGTAMKVGNIDVIKFPDVFLFLHVQKPTGPDERYGVRSHRLRSA